MKTITHTGRGINTTFTWDLTQKIQKLSSYSFSERDKTVWDGMFFETPALIFIA